MHGGDDANEEIESNPAAFLQSGLERFGSDASHACLPVRFVRERVVDVLRELAVDADRLQLVKHGVSGAFEHRKVSGIRYQAWSRCQFS
jgi:hypothetical protein